MTDSMLEWLVDKLCELAQQRDEAKREARRLRKLLSECLPVLKAGGLQKRVLQEFRLNKRGTQLPWGITTQ